MGLFSRNIAEAHRTTKNVDASLKVYQHEFFLKITQFFLHKKINLNKDALAFSEKLKNVPRIIIKTC